MKKKQMILAVYAISAATYICVFLLSSRTKCINSWIGFSFAMLSLLLSFYVVSTPSNTEYSAFPIKISTFVFSLLYVIACLLVNLFFGYTDNVGNACVPTNRFIIIEIILLAIYLIISILLYALSKHIDKTNND